MTFTDEDVEAADDEGRDMAAAVAALLVDLRCSPAIAMMALARVLAGVLWETSDGDPARIEAGADLCNNAIRTYAGNYGDGGAGPLQ